MNWSPIFFAACLVSGCSSQPSAPRVGTANVLRAPFGQTELALGKFNAQERETELAHLTQRLFIKELGIRITVPGDVSYSLRTETKLGSPDVLLTGRQSRFALIVTNARSDELGLSERIKLQEQAFRHGIDILKKTQAKSGFWDFEYRYSLTVNGLLESSHGYFARKELGPQRFNCFFAGMTHEQVERVSGACTSITLEPTSSE